MVNFYAYKNLILFAIVVNVLDDYFTVYISSAEQYY